MICSTTFFKDRLRTAAGMVALVLATAFFSIPGPAEADGLSTPSEYIVGFFRYVQWPDEDRLQNWTVCFVGKLPPEQAQFYADRSARDKPFIVRGINADAPLGECQALDLSTVDADAAKHILHHARNLPILTVGSGSEFCSIGGQICLHLNADSRNRSPKFEVNLSTFRNSKLEISARLLTIGQIRASSGDAK